MKPKTAPTGPRSRDRAPISPARKVAFAILLQMESGRGHADDLLRAERVSALTEQDRRLVTALVMGTLRWQIRLDAAIIPFLTRPGARLEHEIHIALRLGAFQLLFLDRIPAHAAISESVDLAKQAGHRFAAGMVNAVLRKLAALAKMDVSAPTAGDRTGITTAALAASTAHPEWMVKRWARFYGMKTAEGICWHGQEAPTIALRVTNGSDSEASLAEDGVELTPGALLMAARRVRYGDVTKSRAFASGAVRIQEEGSQLIAVLAGTSDRILDCCAAPGGKTLILAERNPGSKITACESDPTRLAAMSRRFSDLNRPELTSRIELIQADATALTEGNYGLAVADVPCSGTGTLGRNPEIRNRLHVEDLARHHELQCAILRGALRTCRAEDARVVYSTCSLEPEENTDVIVEVLASEPSWRQVSLAARIEELAADGSLTAAGAAALLGGIETAGALLLLPGMLGSQLSTDGFFVAMLQGIP